MGCLYCGKEIGPFRLLRDREFCSAEHRKNHGRRLGAALEQMLTPEPAPAGIAGFQIQMPVKEGSHEFVHCLGGLQASGHSVRTVGDWPLTIAAVRGSSSANKAAFALASPAAAGPARPSLLWRGSRPPAVRTDGVLALAPLLGPAELGRFESLVALAEPEFRMPAGSFLPREIEWPVNGHSSRLPSMSLGVAPEAQAKAEATAVPELCERWMTSPAAEAAEREVLPAAALDRLMTSPKLPELRLGVAAEGHTELIPEPCEVWMTGPWAQAAERELIPAAAIGLLDGFPMRMPELQLEAPADTVERIPEPSEQWMPTARAEAAEREVLPAAEHKLEMRGLHLPELQLEVAADAYEEIPEPCEQTMPAARAEAAEREVIPAAAEYRFEMHGLRMPELQLGTVAEPVEAIPEPSEQWMPAARAEAAERQVVPAAAAECTLEIRGLRMPELELAAIGDSVEQVPEPSEQWMPCASAESAERLTILAVAAECKLEIRGLALPVLDLGVAAGARALQATAQPLACQTPEAAERWMSPATAAALGFRTVRLPELHLAVALDSVEQIPEQSEQWMPAASADAAEREVIPVMASLPIALCAVRLPELSLALSPVHFEQIPDFCYQQPVEPVAALPAVAGLQAASVATCLPAMSLEPAAAALRPAADVRTQEPAAPPAANPDLAAQADVDAAAQGSYLPEMSLAVSDEPAKQTPDASEEFLTSAPAEAAERMVVPVMAAYRQAAPAASLPAWQFNIATHVPSTGLWKECEAPQAAAVAVAPRFREMPLRRMRFPIAALKPIGDVLAKPEPREMAAAAESKLPPPVESCPEIKGFVAQDVPFTTVVLQPALTLSENVEFASAFDPGSLVGPSSSTAPNIAPGVRTGERADGVPTAGFAPLDFYCETGVRAPKKVLALVEGQTELELPEPTVKVVPYRAEDRLAEMPARKPLADTLRVIRRELANNFGVVAKIAACLMLISSIWLGSRMLSQMHRDGFSASALEGSHSGVPSLTAYQAANSKPKQVATGTMASLRHAIASRAAVEVTDTFDKGMPAWGAAPQQWAHGWMHDAAGYVRPGDMALFQPSVGYKDYRMEFSGQIETKSIDWMVRAQDSQNYYAMKFKVLEAGLRPVIAMVHYPVVGGIQGHSIETPLNVMMHNNTPYRVAVDVKGNRIVTSIEGQEVDVWTDDTLASGGVGFFSDAGSRARVYWMKISKNTDMLGRICAFLAGSENATDTAEVWGREMPAGPTRTPAPAPRDDAAMAVVALVPLSGRAGREKSSNRWRVEIWS